MKLKAVVFADAPPALIESLNAIRYDALHLVLIPFLQVPPHFGPAEFYVQQCDLCNRAREDSSHDHMCVVGLSNVSGPTIARARSIDGYFKAQAKLQELYAGRVKSYLPFGSRCQLYVSIALDSPIPDTSGRPTTLVEGPTVWVQGEFRDTPSGANRRLTS